jgi:hypothetical protein
LDDAIGKADVKITIEGQSDAQSDTEVFQQVLVELLMREFIPESLPKALAAVPEDRRQFYESPQQLEGEVLYHWIHAAETGSFDRRRSKTPQLSFTFLSQSDN